MSRTMAPAIYSQVAYDIAVKIATGELKEGSKFSGRSLMAVKYAVSQETIRRALNILADMGIIFIQENSGATVLSSEKASLFIEKFISNKDAGTLKKELHSLLTERDKINSKITELINQITDLNNRFQSNDPLRNYELEILPTAHIIGMTLYTSAFRKNTNMLITAIKRDNNILFSPGPETVFNAHDVLVVSGNPSNLDKVKQFIQ